jgi:hypothetical protein
MTACPHCGMIHQTTCSRIKAIEYNTDGVTVKRVEFHSPQPLVTSRATPPVILDGLANTYGHQSSGLANACEQDEGA